jgi:hypothetical protein
MKEKCNSFEGCDASLCPLDPGLSDRVWYADEDICKGRAGSGKRWIRKQRSIQRNQTKSWLNRPTTYQNLYDASRPRQISEAAREKLVARARQMWGNEQTKAHGVVV